MKHYVVTIVESLKQQGSTTKRVAMLPLKRGLLAIKRGLAQETRETKVMLKTYHRFTKGQASVLEMKEANQQFVDVIRSLGLGVLVVLPFSPITLPFVVKLGEKLGVNILPSAFKSDYNEKDTLYIQPEIEVIIESEIVITPPDDKS